MTGRLSGDELDRLADAVCGSHPPLDADQRRAAGALYPLLAAGRPVIVERLAGVLGVESAHAEASLATLPNVERDADGAVTGFGGLTLRPTPHRLIVNGRTGYAWCAWDTLFLPVALRAEAAVFSRCGRTGRPVTLRVTPTGVPERDPVGVALSFIHPDRVDPTRLRASFCNRVEFLAGTDDAGPSVPGGRFILHLDDAFELGRRMITQRCGRC